MSAQEAYLHFVEPMRRRFVVPQGLPADGFLADVAETLAGYSENQLVNAAKWFRETRETRTFPTEAECRKACERYSETSSQAAESRFTWKSQDEIRAEERIEHQRRRDAARLCRCEMGERADREGWLNALIEFVVENARLPKGREINDVIGIARRNEDSLAALMPDPARWCPLDKQADLYVAAKNLRQLMHERAHRDVFGDASC